PETARRRAWPECPAAWARARHRPLPRRPRPAGRALAGKASPRSTKVRLKRQQNTIDEACSEAWDEAWRRPLPARPAVGKQGSESSYDDTSTRRGVSGNVL